MKTLKCAKLLLGIFAGSVLTAVLTLTSGCFLVAVGAAGAAGAGTVAYIKGELNVTLSHGLNHVDNATNQALAQLQFAKVSEAKDAFAANIIGRTADDQKITIILTKEGDKSTKVQIRIGVFGDEGKSRAILDRINSNL